MNLVLSAKAAKKLKKDVHSREGFIPELDTWRVDCLSLRKRSIFVITNEKTLYTHISSFKNGINGILDKITSTASHKYLEQGEIHFLKFTNRRIISSMNDMKNMIRELDQYYPASNEEFGKLINQTPLKYLSYRSPAEVHSSSLSNLEEIL